MKQGAIGWLCDVGDIDPPTIHANGYLLDGNLNGKLAGFQINWSEMEKWVDGHPNAPAQGTTGVGPVYIRAMCWWGGQKERPQDLSEVINLTTSVNVGGPTYVVGRLPDRTNPPENKNMYSCVFGMRQSVDILQTPVSEATTLFWNGEKGTDGSDVTDSEVGYITEGTNDGSKGNVFIESSAIRPSNEMQDWLSGKEAAEDAGQLWPHFRKSAEVPQDNRNPWQECVNNGNCGVAGSN